MFVESDITLRLTILRVDRRLQATRPLEERHPMFQIPIPFAQVPYSIPVHYDAEQNGYRGDADE